MKIQKRQSAKWRPKLLLAVGLVAALLGGAGIYWALQGVPKPYSTVPPGPMANRQEAEGRDETPIDESTLDTYKVANDQPRIITIDALRIVARVQPMGVNTDGSMQAPLNIYDAGWYTGSVKPGEQGAVVIDGHASGPTREGLFAYLDTLRIGDTMTIERGDGVRLAYRVVHTETVALDDIDMKKVVTPYEGVSEGLNLITCAGSWLKDQKTFDQRVTVYTERVE